MCTRVKNVLIITFDSLRSDFVTELKKKNAPNFCKIKDEGAFFRNTIVQAPFTIPSHCSMFTGKYPVRINVQDMQHQLPSEYPSIFNILQQHNFTTLAFAATPMLQSRKITGIDKEVILSTKYLKKMLHQVKNKQFLAFLHYWDTHTPYETILPVRGPIDIFLNLLTPLRMFKNTVIGRKIENRIALKLIDRIRTLVKVHDERIIDSIKNGYRKSIYRADKMLGAVLKALEKNELMENTLLIVFGDHGDSFNEHNEVHKQEEMRYEHGHFLYDNILKVPLILYSPNIVLSKSFGDQAQLTDIVPTILEATRIPWDDEFDGISLWGAVTGAANSLKREFTFSEVVRATRNIELRSIRSLKTKLIKNYKSDSFELYDLVFDPMELNDLWPEDPHGEKAKMLEELSKFSLLGDKQRVETCEEDKQKIDDVLRKLGYL